MATDDETTTALFNQIYKAHRPLSSYSWESHRGTQPQYYADQMHSYTVHGTYMSAFVTDEDINYRFVKIGNTIMLGTTENDDKQVTLIQLMNDFGYRVQGM